MKVLFLYVVLSMLYYIFISLGEFTSHYTICRNQMCAWGILLLILLNWNAGYCFSPPTRYAFLLPSSTKSFLKKHQQQGAFRCRLLFVVAATPDWTNRPDDKVFKYKTIHIWIKYRSSMPCIILRPVLSFF